MVHRNKPTVHITMCTTARLKHEVLYIGCMLCVFLKLWRIIYSPQVATLAEADVC